MASKITKVGRDAGTGEFIRLRTAKQHRRTAVETIRRGEATKK
jgi:hypothetical protein